MKSLLSNKSFSKGLAFGLLAVHVLAGVAFAAEEAASWRPLYDTIMAWINFGFLCFLGFRYARKPVMNFFKDQKDQVKKRIDEVEKARQEAAGRVADLRQQVAESQVRLKSIQQKIVAEGEARREEIIAEANRHGALMIEEAGKRISYHIVHAKANFKAELVEAAIAIAEKRLPELMTAKDHQQYLDLFMSGIKEQ